METLGNTQIQAAGLADWRKLAQALHARFRVPDPDRAPAVIAAIVAAAGADGDHLELRLTHGALDLTIGTRQDGVWVTQTDLELARTVSGIARDHGLEPQPTAVVQLELALDTAHEDAVGPFWAALLHGDPAGNRIHDTVLDPTGRLSPLWFQRTDEHEPPRQRWHFDLWLAPEIAEGRIAVAVAAGGTVVHDAGAPAYTVLADPDGNRVCVCTSLERD